MATSKLLRMHQVNQGPLCSAWSQFGHRLRGPGIVLGCTLSLKSAMMNHWTTSKNRRTENLFGFGFFYTILLHINFFGPLDQFYWFKVSKQNSPSTETDVRMPGPSSHSFHQQVQQAWGTVLKAHPLFTGMIQSGVGGSSQIEGSQRPLLYSFLDVICAVLKAWGRLQGEGYLLGKNLRNPTKKMSAASTYAVHEKHGGYTRLQ